MAKTLATMTKKISTDGSLEAIMAHVKRPALLMKKVERELAVASDAYLKKRLSHAPGSGKTKPFKRSGELANSFVPSALTITEHKAQSLTVDFSFNSVYARLQDKGMKNMRVRNAKWLTIPIHPKAFTPSGKPKRARTIKGLTFYKQSPSKFERYGDTFAKNKPTKKNDTLYLWKGDVPYYVLKHKVTIPRTYFVTKDLMNHLRAEYVSKYYRKAFQAYKSDSRVTKGEVKDLNKFMSKLGI